MPSVWETKVTIFKEWKAACLSTFQPVTARQAFDLKIEILIPLPLCCLLKSLTKCQSPHIYFVKQMISIDHPLSTITVPYYFSHILHVPTKAARHCIFVLELIPTGLQTPLAYVMLIRTACSDTANSCCHLLSCTLLVLNAVP